MGDQFFFYLFEFLTKYLHYINKKYGKINVLMDPDIKINISPNVQLSRLASSTEQEKTWYGRVWKVISSPFVWLVEKIVAFVNDLFSDTKDKKSASPMPKPDQSSLVSPKDIGPVNKTIVENITKDLEGILSFLRESICPADFESMNSLCDDKTPLKDQLEPFRKFCSLSSAIQNNIHLAIDLYSEANDELKQSLDKIIEALKNEIRSKFQEELAKNADPLITLFHSIEKKIASEKNLSQEFLKEWAEILYFLKNTIEDVNPAVEPLKKAEKEVSLSLKQVISDFNKTAEDQSIKSVEEKKATNVIRGIVNIWNSCYMNSVLQAMFASTRISALIDQSIPLTENPDLNCSTRPPIEVRQSLKNFRNLYCNVEKKSDQVANELLTKGAYDLRQTIFSTRISIMSGLTSQQDAAELMRPLLDTMGVSFKSKIKTCTKENEKESPHIQIKNDQMLLLELPQQREELPFEKLLDRYAQVEKVQDPVNKWRYKYKSCEKEYSISEEIPNILVVQLKRFQWTQVGSKIDTPVVVGDIVDFAPIIDSELKQNGESTRYKLCSYVNHHGTTGGGHYTANRKDNDIWKKCNDSVVSELPSKSEKVDRQDAYLLVFERVL